MILNTLRLSNYKQYADLSLDFREGLVGVIGKNGAGKSTIFEAILYCLFGRDEGNKSLVRSSFAGEKATVELVLDFTIGEILYRVRREFRGKALAVNAEFYKNDLLIAKGVSTVNDELVKVLHMERDAFKRSVFSGQKELSELSDTTGEARKRMVRRMLGLDTLDDAQSRVNADIRELNSQAAGQRQSLLDTTAIETLKNEIAERENALKTNHSEAAEESKKLRHLQEKYRAEKEKFDREETRFKQHSTLQNQLAQARERLTGLDLQHESLDKKSLDLQQQKAKTEATRGEWAGFETDKKSLEALESERTRHVNREARMAKITEAREQLAASVLKVKNWEQALENQADITTSLTQKQHLVEQLEAEMETRRSELRSIEQEIGGIQSSLRERAKKLENLRQIGSEGTCPTCLQPLLEGYERALSELETEITTLQNTQLNQLEARKKDVTDTGIALKNRQTKARAEASQLLQEQTRLSEMGRQQTTELTLQKQLQARLTADEAILREIGDVHFDETTHAALKSKLAAQEPRYREFLSQENYITRELPATLEALKTNQASRTEASQKIAALGTELASVGYDEAAYNLAKQAVADFTEAYQSQTETLRALEKAGMELQTEQAKAADRLQTNEHILRLIRDKLDEIELLRKLAEMLGLFKTEILEKVSPGISREASDLFSRITKGKYEGIRVDQNFDFTIADGGQFYPIERFSGGEVDLANFCLRIAITKAIMDLSGTGQRLEFLAFDEIFGSQDEERRMEMMLALNYLQEQFRQIYIVSHIESLKDYFPHLLEVQSVEEGSVALWR